MPDEHRQPNAGENQPPGAPPPAGDNQPPGARPLTGNHLEGYKLLLDMYQEEESNFWIRNQAFLTLNSGLVVILVGILTLVAKQTSGTASTTPSNPTPPAGAQAPIVIQQIVNQAPAAGTGLPFTDRLPLAAVCLMGILLCLVWTVLIKRAQGMSDHFANHMKYLERLHLPDITNMRWYDKLFDQVVPAQRRWPMFLPDKNAVPELAQDAAPQQDRLPRWGTLFRLFTAWMIIAGSFIGVWVVLLFWIAWH